MERELSLPAGGNPEALIRRSGRRAWMIALVVVAMASAAEAKPKRRDARAQYDRGIAHYQLGNYEAASAAFSKSFELERDVETVFAWAQSERMLDHCDKAIDLYHQALTFKMPPENKTAIQQKLLECEKIIAQQKPPAPAEPVVEPQPAEPKPSRPPEPAPVVAENENPLPQPAPPPVDSGSRSSVWYTDPVTLGLFSGGVVAGGTGVALYLSSRSLSNDIGEASDIHEARNLRDKSDRRLTIARITGGVGGALLVGGVAWIMLRGDSGERRTVTGWVTGDGGGIAVIGGF